MTNLGRTVVIEEDTWEPNTYIVIRLMVGIFMLRVNLPAVPPGRNHSINNADVAGVTHTHIHTYIHNYLHSTGLTLVHVDSVLQGCIQSIAQKARESGSWLMTLTTAHVARAMFVFLRWPGSNLHYKGGEMLENSLPRVGERALNDRLFF